MAPQFGRRSGSLIRSRARPISASLLLVGLAVLLAFLLHPGAAPARGKHVASRQVAAAQSKKATLASISAQFNVFTAPARSSDALPAQPAYAASGGAIEAGGTTRQVGPAGDPVTAWATAKGDQLCITIGGASSGVASGGPFACNQLSVLRKPNQLLVMEAGSGTGPAQVVAGLVPDNVSSVTVSFTNGTQAVAPVANNGFVLSTAGRTPSTYKWVANGIQNTE